MTNRNKFPRLRNGNLEGGGLPPYFVLDSKKQVVFHIKGGFPTTMAIPIWIKRFPSDYKGMVVRCEETFYKMRAKGDS